MVGVALELEAVAVAKSLEIRVAPVRGLEPVAETVADSLAIPVAVAHEPGPMVDATCAVAV